MEPAPELPYRVEESQEAGRFLVAARDIARGEVVLSDLPLVAGPIYTRTRPVCLECLRLLEPGSSVPCPGCSLPLCSPACEDGPAHRDECRVFREAGGVEPVGDFTRFHPLYSCITPLRVLLLAHSSPSSVINTFMDHDSDRRKKDSPAWVVHEMLVVKLVTETLRLTHFSQKDVRRAIGILRTNCVKLEPRAGRGDGIAIYPNYTYANHSCVCNTHTRKHRDHRLELVAQADIPAGEQVWTRYTTPQIGSYQRVPDIQKTWHFTCSCARCSDPRELGSLMSALHCPAQAACPGLLLPRAPTVVGGPWACDSCGRTLGVTVVQEVVRTALDRITVVREQDNMAILALAEELGQTSLHPNHYLLLGLKEIVVARLMGAVRGGNLEGEALAEAILLRSRVFREVAEVLELVDSKGAGWLSKAAKLEEEGLRAVAECRGGGE